MSTDTQEIFEEIQAVMHAGMIVYTASMDAVSRHNWKAFDILRHTHQHLKARNEQLLEDFKLVQLNPFIG